MNESLALHREFSLALHGRAIDSCQDIEELRNVAKTLLQAWQMQASFSEEYAGQLMGIKPRSF